MFMRTKLYIIELLRSGEVQGRHCYIPNSKRFEIYCCYNLVCLCFSSPPPTKNFDCSISEDTLSLSLTHSLCAHLPTSPTHSATATLTAACAAQPSAVQCRCLRNLLHAATLLLTPSCLTPSPHQADRQTDRRTGRQVYR